MQSNLKYLVFILSIVLVFGDQLDDVNGEIKNGLNDQNNATAASDVPDLASSTIASSANNSDIKKLTKKRCAREYNMNCLKVDLISSVEKLGKTTDFQLLPGVRVVGNSDIFMSQRADDSRMVFSADNVSNQLDELLVRRLVSYAKSLSLNVQIFDKDQKRGKSLGLTSFFPNLLSSFEGRDKKQGKWSGTLITAAVLTGGTLLWMGLSSLMAMATKALAASLLSIVISIVTAYRSSGSSHKSTTYEIVAKPVYPHPYSADIQHDPHAAATGHQYQLGRNMEWDKNPSMSSRSEVHVPIREDAHQLVYRAHVRPIFKT